MYSNINILLGNSELRGDRNKPGKYSLKKLHELLGEMVKKIRHSSHFFVLIWKVIEHKKITSPAVFS